MNAAALQEFQNLRSRIDMRIVLTRLCRPFGAIVSIEVVDTAKDDYLCIVELETRGQNAALCRGLGGFPFGEAVGFYIPKYTGA